jgi:hypothetical protein
MSAMKKIYLLLCLLIPAFAVQAQADIMLEADTISQVAPVSKLKYRDKPRPAGKSWYIYGGSGYGIEFLKTNKFSPFKEIGNKDWYQDPNVLSVKPVYGTLGGGFAANFGWGHMFNEHIGIDVLHTIAWHPERLDARINTQVDLGGGRSASYFAEEYSKILGIYINPHLVMHWDNKKRFGITGKAGLCLPIGGVPVSRAHIIDRSGRLLETLTGLPVIPVTMLADFYAEYTAKAKTSLNPTVGVSASLAFDLRLMKNIWAFAEIRVQAFTIKLKETKFEEFSLVTESPLLPLFEALTPLPLNIANAAEAPEYLKHFVYVNEITEESNTMRYTGADGQIKEIDPNRPMEEPGARFNASTMYFNVGLRMNFAHHWDKKRMRKMTEKQDEKALKKEAKKGTKSTD